MDEQQASSPYIRVQGLQKTYIMGRVAVHALAGVDLVVSPNTFLVVMGPSGSGKSTLLHLLGGLDRPTNGHIQVGGQALESLDENELAVFRRKTVGFIFQSFNLVSSMSALENVEFPMRFAQVARRKRKEVAMEQLHLVGLEDRAHHKPTELSGGQQQRVAIARALVNDPHLILADEPTGNLDTTSGLGIMRLLSDLHQGERTVIVVSHDTRVTQFASRTIELLDGRITDGGTTGDGATKGDGNPETQPQDVHIEIE